MTDDTITCELPEFIQWPKTWRLNREMIVTEKIDGTNGCIVVDERGQVYAQSRNRMLSTSERDSFGFYQWVRDHARSLENDLGSGYHFGEWYGRGIQRGYDLDEKRFMLFNVERWEYETDGFDTRGLECATVLYRGPFSNEPIERCVKDLRDVGSIHVPHYARPEGVVIHHRQSRVSFKVTLEKDADPKSITNGG